MLATSLPTYAQEPVAKLPVPATPMSQGRVSPMSKGDKAIFDGILFDSYAAAWLIVQKKDVEERIKIERDNATAIEKAKGVKDLADAKASATTTQKVMQASLDERQKRIELLTKQINDDAKRSDPPLVLWIGLGAIAGTLVTLGAVAVVGAVK
jgi:hypothetical protein